MQEFNWCGWFSRRKEKIEVSVETQESWKIDWLEKKQNRVLSGLQNRYIFYLDGVGGTDDQQREKIRRKSVCR